METPTAGTAGSNDEREEAKGTTGLGGGPGADGAEGEAVSLLGPPNASVGTEGEGGDATADEDGAAAGLFPGSKGKERRPVLGLFRCLLYPSLAGLCLVVSCLSNNPCIVELKRRQDSKALR